MTDKKEIIIDSVDVSGCKHYNPEQYFECNIGCCHCEENPDCYYKQLNRKEQECEKIKQALDIIEEYCMQCNLRWDFTAQFILNTINKLKNK